MKQLFARDVMRTDVIVVSDTLNVSDLARFLLDKNISGAPVTDKNNNFVGVVSTKDITRFETERAPEINSDIPHDFYVKSYQNINNEDKHHVFSPASMDSRKVRDIMTPMMFRVNVDAKISEVAALMVHGQIHRLLVVEKNVIVGIITSMDLVKLLEIPNEPQQQS